MSKVIDISNQLIDAAVERILHQTDDEIMANAAIEYGSIEAAKQKAEQTRKMILDAIKPYLCKDSNHED